MRTKTNDALNNVVKNLTELPGGDAFDVSMNVLNLISEISDAESDLHDCVNELCMMCGSYHESYLGACDGCRWKSVKESFRTNK